VGCDGNHKGCYKILNNLKHNFVNLGIAVSSTAFDFQLYELLQGHVT